MDKNICLYGTWLLLPFVLNCAFAADTSMPRTQVVARAGPPEPRWEARVPLGSETDPIALNIAFGQTQISNRDTVENLRGAYKIKPHSFDSLRPKAKINGIFKVTVDEHSGKWVPPDMGGTGPFYLIRTGSVYFALTSGNFARLFSPIDRKEDVLPYLRVYESLFTDQFAEIVTTDSKGGPREPGRTPPRLTEVTERGDGFTVRLVTYTLVHVEAFFEKTIHLGRDGIVKVERPEVILKEYGPGIMF